MERAKIQLSEDELQLVQNGAWILTKNDVIEKICNGLGVLAERMQEEIAVNTPQLYDTLNSTAPKISRGEKYQGLPYLILDYPRSFQKEDIQAIRTLFWWGNFCSITLHVKGTAGQRIASRVISVLTSLQNHGFYVSFNGDEWNHNVTSRDYEALTVFSEERLCNQLDTAPFFKIAGKVEFSQWEIMEEKLFKHFQILLNLL